MQWLQEQLQSFLPLISNNLLIQASLIFLIAAILSVVARFIISRIQTHAAGRTKTDIDDYFFELIKKPLNLSILFAGAHLALLRSELLGDHLALVDSILISIVIFYWIINLSKFSRFALKQLSRDDGRLKIVQKHTLPLFDNLAIVLFYGAGIYFIFVTWKIDVTAWVASAGILGLALSFAAKDTLANLFAGVFILADTPYKIGDYIVLESGERGCVTHIGIRSTRILTRSDVEITIPNAIMGNTKVINETAGPHKKYRLRIKVGVAYGSDIQLVRKTLLKAVEDVDQVEKTPEARVRFRTFGDSSLDFELLCWVAEPVLRGKVSDIINENVYNLFNQNKISIPFPQRDVNMRQLPTE
jgi:MscS family membrane protein